MSKRICPGCNIEKENIKYSKNKNSWHGLSHYCKECSTLRYKNWRQSKLIEIRRRDRINHFKRKYNLDDSVAEALADNRIGNCEICKIEDLLVVDHNHQTRKVRGFICSNCNSALGYVKENKEIIGNLIKYLDKYNE